MLFVSATTLLTPLPTRSLDALPCLHLTSTVLCLVVHALQSDGDHRPLQIVGSTVRTVGGLGTFGSISINGKVNKMYVPLAHPPVSRTQRVHEEDSVLCFCSNVVLVLRYTLDVACSIGGRRMPSSGWSATALSILPCDFGQRECLSE